MTNESTIKMVSAQKNKWTNNKTENNEPPTSAIPGAHPAGSVYAIPGAIAPV